MADISKELRTRHPIVYNHNPMQVLAAARVLASTKQVLYLQLDPGNGKTFVNLLALAAM